MWVFSDFGLLMPAIVPKAVQNREDVLKWTNNGEYELQVRARLREHLQYFMDNYMEEGTFNPEIQATPDKDYNFRFYTTREAFAIGIGNIARNMDYEKFKDSSMRFSWNKKYHSLLTRIWGVLCDLNTPGGIWGPKSKDNPHGYEPAWKYGNTRGYRTESRWDGYEEYSGDWRTEKHQEMDSNVRVGDSFGQREDDDPPFEHVDFNRPLALDDDGYLSAADEQAIEIINELDGANIPEGEWVYYTSPGELAKVTAFLKKSGSNNSVRKVMKGAKKFRRENKKKKAAHVF